MSEHRVLEGYRRHKLLSAFHGGKYKGRVWKDKKLLTEIEGQSIAGVLKHLRDFVDAKFVSSERDWNTGPASEEFHRAFQNILPGLAASHLVMLKAHFHAPNQEISATQLAEAAGYADYGAANLQYGNVGKMLYEELPMKLPKYKDGTNIYTFALATGSEKVNDEGHWVWKMRPEVASAIAALGLDA